MLDSHLFPMSSSYKFIRRPRRGMEPGFFPMSGSFTEHAPDLRNFDGLHPLEKALLDQAVDSRRAEFGDARWCAHEALKELGGPWQEPILRGERGMPLWPAGYVGSITHTDGFRAAVVVPATEARSVGLDAEPSEPLSEGVLAAIARPAELSQVAQMKAAGVFYADKLLFCAKEATYKAWFPLTQRFLDFDEADIELRLDGTLTSRVLSHPTPVPFIEGRWVARNGYVIVSAVVPN